MGYHAAKVVRLQPIAHLMFLLCLLSLGFVDRGAIAQELAGQAPWRMAKDLTLLTVEQERVRSSNPGSDFKEYANGCPVMIVIPGGNFTMGSPENEPDRISSEGPPHEVTIAQPRPFQVRGDVRRVGCLCGRGCVPAVISRCAHT
jgi:hypothetical protein